MEVKITIILLMAIFLAFEKSRCEASASNPNGAIHARVTANGLNYINEVLRRPLEAEIRRARIPSISASDSGAYYQVNNIRIERLVPGPSSIQSTSRGLRWQLTYREIRVYADWKIGFSSGWFKIGDSGHVNAYIRNLRFDVTLNPRVSNGKLAIVRAWTIPNSCASVSDISMHIGGTLMAWLYNLIIEAFKGLLRREIPKEVCKAAGKEIEKFSRDVFPRIQTSAEVDILNEKFLLDYGLLSPQFENGLANIRFLGEVFPQPKTIRSFPYSPSAMPSTRTSKHVYLVLSDFLANTFLYSAKAKGIGTQTFSASDDRVVKNLLETMCRDVPGNEEGNGDLCADLHLSFDLVDNPKMLFSRTNGMTLQLNNAIVIIRAKTGGQTKEILKIQADVSLSARPRLSDDGRRLHLVFAAPEVNFDWTQPTLPNGVLEQAERVVRMAGGRWGRRALNIFGEEGVELPNVRGVINFKDQELIAEDGALVIASNLVINI